LALKEPSEAFAIVEKYFSVNQILPKTQYVVSDVFDRLKVEEGLQRGRGRKDT
jgi:hypothetical protein